MYVPCRISSQQECDAVIGRFLPLKREGSNSLVEKPTIVTEQLHYRAAGRLRLPFKGREVDLESIVLLVSALAHA